MSIPAFPDGRPIPDPSFLYRHQEYLANRRRILMQVLLFVLTIVSTYLVGGFAYSLCLVAILLFHEMGHYFAARHYGVSATLPYFIPFPLNAFGTFGAVIKLQGAIPHRKALFDIGIMGPALGVVVALPATILGIALSTVTKTSELGHQTIALGDSLLFKLKTP